MSHGELLRSGTDEFLEVDPDRLRFLIQGVDAAGYRAEKYGQIPWRLGLMEAADPAASPAAGNTPPAAR